MSMSDFSKRTKQETIDYFKGLSWYFRDEARKEEKSGDTNQMRYFKGKAEAYEIAAFELERNMV